MRPTSSLPAERLGLRAPMVEPAFLARQGLQELPAASLDRPVHLDLPGPRGRKALQDRPFQATQVQLVLQGRMPRRQALPGRQGHPEEQHPVRLAPRGRPAPTDRKVCPARLVLLVLLAPMPRVDLAVLALPGSQA